MIRREEEQCIRLHNVSICLTTVSNMIRREEEQCVMLHMFRPVELLCQI